MEYNLEDRTLDFSNNVINLCKKIKINNLNKSLVDQLVRSATSVGANYREANGASSKKDFLNKIYICKKEAKETNYWLTILLGLEIDLSEEIEPVRSESHELCLIFCKIANTTKINTI